MSDVRLTGDRPLRRIEHPGGGYFETRLTDEELAEKNQQMAARRAAVLASSMATTLAERRVREAEREAADDAEVDRLAQRGRDDLRDAHQVLAQARADLEARLRAFTAAERHVATCQTAVDQAERLQQEHDAAAVAALTAGFTGAAEAQIRDGRQYGGIKASPPEVDRAVDAAALEKLGETRTFSHDRLHDARRDLDHAIGARDALSAQVGAAEAVVAAAEVRVKSAARTIIRIHVRDRRAEIAGLNKRVEELLHEVNGLLPCLADRNWPVPWPQPAAALLADPEADLLKFSTSHDVTEPAEVPAPAA